MHPAHPHHTRQLDAAPAMKAPPPKNHKHGTHDQVMDRNEMGRLGLGLQYHLGDPHEPTRRNSMMSSVYSGPSVESSHYTIDTDGFSLLNVVDEATEKSNDHKKKKEKKEKKLKLDEHGNPIKKMKSKKKVKEVDSADSQVPHHESHHHQTYTTDRQIHSEDYFLSQTDELEEFDDYFIKQNQQKQANRALLERNKSNDVAPFKSHLDDDEPRQWYKSNSESAHMTPRTNRSVHTGTTMSSTESFPPPPVMSIDVHRDMNIYEDDDNNNDETRDTAEFHGEMLQGFLQRNGHDQQLALQTAMAFEAFLRQQQEKMARFNEICGSSQQSQSKTNSFGEAHYGEDVSFEDHDLEIMEKRGFHSAGSFPPLNSREDITFGSNRDLNIQKQHACHQYNTLLQGERWPSTQQNEDFLYRLPCDGLASERDTMLYRNMVAASQRDIAAHPQFNLFSSHMPTNEMAPYPAPGLSRNVSAEQTPYEQQMASLSVEKRACVIHLKMKWERRVHGESVLPDEWYIRFAKCSPGEPFDAKSAWRIMTKFDQRYLNLSILSMEKQLLSKIIFPCPGLKSKAGHDMFYMRPSRYFPKKTSVNAVIDNLAYVMGSMLEKEKSATDGIALVANMTEWTMTNFSIPYWNKLMMTLQGHRVPTRVELLLFVNPPSWFGSIWSIMKQMLSEDFGKKVHIIKLDRLKEYLAPGFEEYLPDDIQGGMASTAAMVQSFVADRKEIESLKILRPRYRE